VKIKSVLIVDDSESDQMLAELAITAFDNTIQILKAYDGEEALDILSTAKLQPDVIFLDINMPGIDGHEFLELYNQQQDKNHLVIILTSSSHSKDKERCLTYPFVKKYAVKPLNSEILEAVENLL
jgi:CheY-like chemotaxis protein